jgi:23S rRNA pseudouridine2605 synthase
MIVRLQKFLADAGVASRRAGERLIEEGRVQVNGETVRLQGCRVDPSRDVVLVDGEPVEARRKLYLALNKPRGYVTTRKDERGRKNVMDLLPDHKQHLHPIGRLDQDTEGLLLMTNDGDFSLRLSHPRYGIAKTYVAQVSGRVETPVIQKICKGIYDRGEKLRARKARILAANNTRSIVELELTEGKNREIRRLFTACGHHVERLQRVCIGNVKLGELPPGKWRTLTDSERKSLLPAS